MFKVVFPSFHTRKKSSSEFTKYYMHGPFKVPIFTCLPDGTYQEIMLFIGDEDCILLLLAMVIRVHI